MLSPFIVCAGRRIGVSQEQALEGGALLARVSYSRQLIGGDGLSLLGPPTSPISPGSLLIWSSPVRKKR